MPLVFKRNIKQDAVALWQIDEKELSALENTLLESQRLGYSEVKSLLIKRQKIAVLVLLNQLLGKQVEVEYNADGKPNIKGIDVEVSMSHSQERVAVMLSPKKAGLDLQEIHPKIERIIHKFLSQEELDSLDEAYRVEHSHVFWCAKEALYKVYSKRGLIFSEQILITPFQYSDEGGVIQGKILAKGQEWNYQLKYEKIEGYMLVYLLND